MKVETLSDKYRSIYEAIAYKHSKERAQAIYDSLMELGESMEKDVRNKDAWSRLIDALLQEAETK